MAVPPPWPRHWTLMSTPATMVMVPLLSSTVIGVMGEVSPAGITEGSLSFVAVNIRCCV